VHEENRATALDTEQADDRNNVVPERLLLHPPVTTVLDDAARRRKPESLVVASRPRDLFTAESLQNFGVPRHRFLKSPEIPRTHEVEDAH
jgi:hypothetical protein